MKKSLLNIDGKVLNFLVSIWVALMIISGLLLVYKVNFFIPTTAAQAEAQARLISFGKAQVYMGLLILVMRRLRNYLRSRLTKP